MGKLVPAAVAGLLLVAPPVLAGGSAVSVQFVDPDRYVDAGAPGLVRERTLLALAREIERRAPACLRRGETLALRVFDLDLAGSPDWLRAGDGPRVMRERDWPRIEFEYVLRGDAGGVLDAGRLQLSDMNYLWRSARLGQGGDPLRYEKAMLKDWMERRLCRPPAAGA